jgi:hypothetical protein
MRILVYKSSVLYGAGTANLVSHLAASWIDAALSECQISQHNHENYRPNIYPKHETLPALQRIIITATARTIFQSMSQYSQSLHFERGAAQCSLFP